eukprot:PITA_16945
MANCMLQSKSLAPKLWAEAINCASYTQNYIPHKALKGTTPFECWTGYRLLDSHTEKLLVARSVKFEEESLHDFLADPAEELLVATDEEESETSLSTSEKPSEKPLGSDSEDEEKVMAAPTQLPTWAEKTLQDAQPHSKATGNPLWEATMDEEYPALMENNTWDLVPLPKGRNLVRCRWIY